MYEAVQMSGSTEFSLPLPAPPASCHSQRMSPQKLQPTRSRHGGAHGMWRGSGKLDGADAPSVLKLIGESRSQTVTGVFIRFYWPAERRLSCCVRWKPPCGDAAHILGDRRI